MFPRARAGARGHKPQAGGRCHQGFRTKGLESRKAALDLGSCWGHPLLSPSSDGGFGWGRRPLAEPAFPPRPQPAHRVHLPKPRSRPTRPAHLHRPPGLGGQHSFGSAHERGFLTKGQAWVSQMLPGGKSGVQTEACRAAGASRWHSPRGPRPRPGGCCQQRGGQATCLHVSPPPTRPCGTGGPVEPSRRGGGGGSGGSTPPRECQAPVPVATLVMTGVGL